MIHGKLPGLELPSLLCVLAACWGCRTPVDEARGDPPATPVIRGARFTGEYRALPYFGDLWPSTWAADDRLFMSWGDGTGRSGCVPSFDGRHPGTFGIWDSVRRGDCVVLGDPGDDEMHHMFCHVFDCGECLPLCAFTTAGLLALEGPVPDFSPCEEDSCIVSYHLPTGRTPFERGPDPSRNDKPSSLLFLDGLLVLAGHRPSGTPDQAYIAYSEDLGATFTELEGSPWAAGSPFLVAMMVQMGQEYRLDRDGHVYALTVEKEAEFEARKPQSVYLWRVARSGILDYGRYEYFAGQEEGGEPIWRRDTGTARPVPGLATYVQGSAMYHEGTGRYLFLSGATTSLAGVSDAGAIEGGLFEAPHPWGPWRKVARVPGGTIATLIPKGAGPRHVYFTAAGGSVDYSLHVGRLDLETGR